MVRRIRFVRTLGLFDAVMLGIGFIIGSGIYIMPLLAAQQAGAFSIFAWILGGIFAILTGLCFAECAMHLPKAGGLYTYTHNALGNFTGFLAGYAFWLGYIITIATEIFALSWYMQFFVPLSELWRLLIAGAFGAIFTYINYRGVKLGAEIDDIFTIGKMVPLILLIIAGIFFFNPGNFLQPATDAGALANPLQGFMLAILLALWAYLGAEIITVPEEEIKNARKTVPKAVIVAVLTAMAIYVLVAFVSMGAVNWHNFQDSQAPLADIANSLFNGFGAILALGGLISILGALNAVILASARISYAMASDNLFPKAFMHLHKTHKTPDRALILHFIIAIALVFAVQSFTALAALAVLFTLIPYLFTCISTLRLQHRYGIKHILHTPIIPVIAIIACILLIAYSLMLNFIAPLVLIAIGLLIYFAITRRLLRNSELLRIENDVKGIERKAVQEFSGIERIALEVEHKAGEEVRGIENKLGMRRQVEKELEETFRKKKGKQH